MGKCSNKCPVRDQNQDLTFSVNRSREVMACPDQTFDCDGFTLEIREMTVSPTTVRASFYYHMTEELPEDCRNSAKLMLPLALPPGFGEVTFAAVGITGSGRERLRSFYITVNYLSKKCDENVKK